MSRIKVIDFTKEVQRNKTSLIQHCVANGKHITDSASLGTVVALNNTINITGEEEQCRIRWIDYDGTILGTEYVDIGDPLPTHTAPTPSDSRLTFVKWVTQTSSTTVQHDLDFGAVYKCNVEKTIGSTTVNPTILDCNFNSATGLSPTIPLAPTSGHTVYIDWGDGSSVDEVTSTTTKSHTYASAGNYSIQIYSDATWYFNTSSSRYLLGSQVYNSALLRAIIGSEMLRVYDYAFNRCYSLQSVVIPNTVTSINYGAFIYCYSLQSVVIPDTVTSTGTSAFAYCYSLRSAVIPNTVTAISISVFYYCYSLQSVIIPDSVTSINNDAFNNCYSLQSIVIPNTVTFISNNAFSSCTILQSIVIPDSITSISNSAFYYCYSLQSAVIPDTVTAIYDSAFNNCHNLQSVIIPDSVTSIGSSTFQSCFSLQSVVIPDSVITIGTGAFNACYTLQSVVIPLNWAKQINFLTRCYSLTDETLISIANRIADLSGSTAKTITLTTSNQILMMSIFVDVNGDRVPEGTAGAKNLVKFITDKNWTITTQD